MRLEDLRPTWAEIFLDHLAHNMREVKKLAGKNVGTMAVVKANAYGHGVHEAAKVFVEEGANYLAVATLGEAMELRQSQKEIDILILGYTPSHQFSKVIAHNLTQTIYTRRDGFLLDQKAKEMGFRCKIHIKVDTGMSRLGFQPCQEAIEAIKGFMNCDGIIAEGIYTHFACADQRDKRSVNKQYLSFKGFLEQLEERDCCPPLQHCANSAAIIDHPEYHMNMVRGGIMLYGLYPSREVKRRGVDLKPAMSLKARISHIKRVPPHQGISYGHIYKTDEDKIIGTLPIGYADGMSRLLSNKTAVSIGGHLIPQVGRICMDQCMVDLTSLDHVQVGEEVILFNDGREGALHIDDIAKRLGTINYEIVCMVSRRVPRVFIQNDKVVGVRDYLEY